MTRWWTGTTTTGLEGLTRNTPNATSNVDTLPCARSRMWLHPRCMSVLWNCDADTLPCASFYTTYMYSCTYVHVVYYYLYMN